MPLASKDCVDSRLAKELKVDGPIRAGRSKGAKLVQELLGVNGVKMLIDGDWGQATTAGLAAFCAREKVSPATEVDQELMDRLAQPLLRAAAKPKALGSLNETVVATARQHLKEHPIEVGKQNSGPWVRMYMNANEGDAFPWCAGFVTYVVRQAAAAHGTPSPVKRTFSCDNLAAQGKEAKRYTKRISPADAAPGSIFLVPHKGSFVDWNHTGIIIGGDGTAFETIEGNTNDEGSREGFEVCARFRSCAKVDVVTLV